MDLFSPRSPIRQLHPPGNKIPIVLTTEEEEEVEAKTYVIGTPTLTLKITLEEETEVEVEFPPPAQETAIVTSSETNIPWKLKALVLNHL